MNSWDILALLGFALTAATSPGAFAILAFLFLLCRWPAFMDRLERGSRDEVTEAWVRRVS